MNTRSCKIIKSDYLRLNIQNKYKAIETLHGESLQSVIRGVRVQVQVWDGKTKNKNTRRLRST